MTNQNPDTSQSPDNYVAEIALPGDFSTAIIKYNPNNFESFFANVLTRYRIRKIPIYKVFSVDSQNISNF